MAVDFNIKQDDTLPAIQASLELDGEIVVLTGSTVRFIMTDKATGDVKVDAAATVVDSILGVVRYDWIAADTDTPGTYLAEFEVEDDDGNLESFPNTRNLQVKVFPDLGGIR